MREGWLNSNFMEFRKRLSRCAVTNSNCKSSRNTGSGIKLDNSDSEKITNKEKIIFKEFLGGYFILLKWFLIFHFIEHNNTVYIFYIFFFFYCHTRDVSNTLYPCHQQTQNFLFKKHTIYYHSVSLIFRY